MAIATAKVKVKLHGGKRMRASLETRPKTAVSPEEAISALRKFNRVESNVPRMSIPINLSSG